MSRFVILENNTVVNTVIADNPLSDSWIKSDSAIIGSRFVEGEFLPPGAVFMPKTREELKAERDAAVAAIVVTTSTGKQFNGDETSQTRMSRAIVAMQVANAQTITWVLADNTAVEVTLAELSEALVLAGQAQAAIWTLPD